mmetsp:Transcript_30830/g.57813  ORF Transcript_30830/g.57813 Transcript_30830/m.57813 type:complete len:214 (+) Transcript_30830:398-1039(+)
MQVTRNLLEGLLRVRIALDEADLPLPHRGLIALQAVCAWRAEPVCREDHIWVMPVHRKHVAGPTRRLLALDPVKDRRKEVGETPLVRTSLNDDVRLNHVHDVLQVKQILRVLQDLHAKPPPIAEQRILFEDRVVIVKCLPLCIAEQSKSRLFHNGLRARVCGFPIRAHQGHLEAVGQRLRSWDCVQVCIRHRRLARAGKPRDNDANQPHGSMA